VRSDEGAPLRVRGPLLKKGGSRGGVFSKKKTASLRGIAPGGRRNWSERRFELDVDTGTLAYYVGGDAADDDDENTATRTHRRNAKTPRGVVRLRPESRVVAPGEVRLRGRHADPLKAGSQDDPLYFELHHTLDATGRPRGVFAMRALHRRAFDEWLAALRCCVRRLNDELPLKAGSLDDDDNNGTPPPPPETTVLVGKNGLGGPPPRAPEDDDDDDDSPDDDEEDEPRENEETASDEEEADEAASSSEATSSEADELDTTAPAIVTAPSNAPDAAATTKDVDDRAKEGDEAKESAKAPDALEDDPKPKPPHKMPTNPLLAGLAALRRPKQPRHPLVHPSVADQPALLDEEAPLALAPARPAWSSSRTAAPSAKPRDDGRPPWGGLAAAATGDPPPPGPPVGDDATSVDEEPPARRAPLPPPPQKTSPQVVVVDDDDVAGAASCFASLYGSNEAGNDTQNGDDDDDGDEAADEVAEEEGPFVPFVTHPVVLQKALREQHEPAVVAPPPERPKPPPPAKKKPPPPPPRVPHKPASLVAPPTASIASRPAAPCFDD